MPTRQAVGAVSRHWHIFSERFEPERTGNAERQGFQLYFPYKIVYEMFVVPVVFVFVFFIKNVLCGIYLTSFSYIFFV